MEENIIQNEQLIFNSALELFYENGYNNTTFDQIAEKANINKPLITYYFGTKSALVSEIFKFITKRIKNTSALKAYKQLGIRDINLLTAIDMRIVETLYLHDQRANRFFMEAYPSLMEYYTKNKSEIKTDNYNAVYRYRYKGKHNYDDCFKFEMMSLTNRAAVLTLHCSYYNGLINCSFDEFMSQILSFQFMNMGFNHKEIDYYITESEHCMSELKMIYKPYFIVE